MALHTAQYHGGLRHAKRQLRAIVTQTFLVSPAAAYAIARPPALRARSDRRVESCRDPVMRSRALSSTRSRASKFLTPELLKCAPWRRTQVSGSGSVRTLDNKASRSHRS